jgi:hypothetical protein
VTSDGGLFLVRELDEGLGLGELIVRLSSAKITSVTGNGLNCDQFEGRRAKTKDLGP